MRKYLFLITCWFLLGASLSAAENSTNVWVLPCTEQTENYLDYPAKDWNEIVLGKGETEHVQVVLTTIPKEKITITPSGAEAFSVQYRVLSEIGGYNDALVPFQTTVQATGTTTVLWLTFEASRNSAPGTYEYTASIKSIKTKQDLKFKVRVANYEIPLTPSIPSEFCVDINNLPDNGSDEQKELWTEFLLSRRIDPYYSRLMDQATWRWDNCFSPWAWDDARSQKLLQDKRFCRFALPFMIDDNEIVRMCNDMESKGIFDRCYFYIWDEPVKPEQYEQIKNTSTHLLSLNPNAKMLVPVSRFLVEGEHKWDYDYTFDFLKKYVHIFPISAELYEGKDSGAEKFRNYVEPDAEWWTYVCWKPNGEQPNFLLEQGPIQNRAIMWRVWKEQEKGFLYWGVNRYRLNPFAFDTSLGAPGDGGLVFPGDLFGVKEPIASVRLERWKEGQEDYELLKMVEEKAGRHAAEKILEQVYRTPNDLTKSSADIESFRNKMIDIVENYNPASHVIIRGEQYAVDTLNTYTPGPGCDYAHIRIADLPVEAHILKIDLQNKHTQVRTFLGKNTIDGLETVSSACNRYTSETADAYAGINGDFFNIPAHHELPIGAPRGGCISDGVIQREPRSIEWAFATIDYNNKPLLGNMSFEGSVTSIKVPISSYNFYDVNLPRTDCYSCDMTFYNEFAGGYTRMDENANIGDKKKTEVFFKVANDGKWKVNSPVTCVVTRIIKDTEGHNALEAGESALSGIDKAKEFLDKLTVGQKLKIKMTIKTDDNETPDIKEMIGGNSLLMKDGELMDCNFNDSYNNVLYPRTGVGCSKDGRWLYMMAIDGRQSHSRGVYTDEMCDLFRSIGASDVVGFDGGGSTEMVVNHKLVNKPSDGRERAVTDGWLLQTSAPVDNDIVRIAFNYWNKSLIESCSIPLKVMGYNQYGILVNNDLANVQFQCSPELGHIDNQTLVIDGTSKKGVVTATYNGISVSRYLDLGSPSGIDQIVQVANPIDFYRDHDSNIFYLSKTNLEPCNIFYTLYAMDGSCIRQANDELTDTLCLDFSDLSSGWHILQVRVANEIYSFKLLIK
ncbi:MAG: phosphodiester glycosidase family protein [Bacteroidales bacterium]|nr:phosphodiester glycosidase family protein [Bacteroidales bacterium]